MTQQIPKLNIELTVDEANLALRGLGKLPFEESSDVIFKIKSQGEAQVAAANKPAEVAEQKADGPQQLNG